MNDKLFDECTTVKYLGLLERTGYEKITSLIAKGDYDNARKVADILQVVGIV